jgi:sugar-specific transcriptional regulator TrmB
MNTKILEDIGLTKTEIKIYLALLKLGQSTTTNIIKDAGIHASKVYEFLDKLIKKGLVSYNSIAAHPARPEDHMDTSGILY